MALFTCEHAKGSYEMCLLEGLLVYKIYGKHSDTFRSASSICILNNLGFTVSTDISKSVSS